MAMIEPLPYTKDGNGKAVLDTSDEALIKVVAIATGLGASSAYSWLKIPASSRMSEIAGATTLPILMLGGEPSENPDDIFALWKESMSEPNVRGVVAGRTVLYPNDADPEGAVLRAAAAVRPDTPTETKGSS